MKRGESINDLKSEGFTFECSQKKLNVTELIPSSFIFLVLGTVRNNTALKRQLSVISELLPKS